MSPRAMWIFVSLACVVVLSFVLGIGPERSQPTAPQSSTVAVHKPLRPSRREVAAPAQKALPAARAAAAEQDEHLPPYAEGLSRDELAELTAEEFKAHVLGDRLEQRGEEVRRQEVGRQRFERGVTDGGFSAKQMDDAVVALFNGVELEPLLDEQGLLEGLALTDLDEESPLRSAGFRPGDRITRIDEQELRDPAEIPGLLVALNREIDFCAERAGEEICGTVRLD